jgi:4-hydroxybenzoate polyprenyltransferase
MLAWMAKLVKTARPGFWPTTLWFFLLPLGQREMFGSLGFWLGCIYVAFPLGLLLYGWNDLHDRVTDRLNPRKDSWLFGARLSDADLDRLPRWIFAIQLPFALLFTWLFGAKMLAWFFAMAVANAVYNWPGWGWKNWPFLDLLNQVAYLLVFVLAAFVCGVPQLNAPAMVFSALFAMQSHLFGQLMDVKEDRAAGRRTTAWLLGVRGGKLLLVAFMAVEAAIAWNYFGGFFVEAFLGLGALFFLADALFGFKAEPYPPMFSKAFFVGWNAVVISSMYFVWRTGIFLVG